MKENKAIWKLSNILDEMVDWADLRCSECREPFEEPATLKGIYIEWYYEPPMKRAEYIILCGKCLSKYISSIKENCDIGERKRSVK